MPSLLAVNICLASCSQVLSACRFSAGDRSLSFTMSSGDLSWFVGFSILPLFFSERFSSERARMCPPHDDWGRRRQRLSSQKVSCAHGGRCEPGRRRSGGAAASCACQQPTEERCKNFRSVERK